MLDTKLIVIDGLPGSGKTTTIKWLAQQFEQHGTRTEYLFESDLAHPLWWYEYWDGSNYLPPDFDNTPIETFIRNSLAKWRGFAKSLQESDRLIVAESLFFQNATTMFLMGDANPNRLMIYAREVQQIVRQLNPMLIYFHQTDVAAALRRICTIRGPEFQAELLGNMERFPYLRNRNLKGLDDLTQLWEVIQQITNPLFEEFTIRKLAIENSSIEHWADYYQQILKFLQIESK